MDSPTSRWKYDVFLSFRGEDCRTSITDKLYKALCEKGITTFRDSEELKKGKSISPELLKAIEQSRISVVILSSNYASSTWCLDEVAKIVECMESGSLVLPLFYGVDPSEVRKQHTGNYHRYFAIHEDKFKDEKRKVDKWRKALTQVANISGWELKDRREMGIVEQIVEHIFNELNYLDFVGLDRVKKIELDLRMELDEVCVIGICGMPGVGKTTIAKLVTERIQNRFDASSFIVDVGKIVKEKSLFHVQEKLYQDLLESEVKMQNNVNLIWSRLRSKRVLIILDNVNELEQIEAVAGENGKELHERFGRGSRIIITTRDERLLMNYGAKMHKVENLTESEALLLFCRKAFKKDHPKYGFAELSYNFVDYADGVPLALVVLGSFLLDRSIEEWSSALGRLKDNNCSGESKISEILKVGFDALHETEKEMFLDIACFFKGDDATHVQKIFESCGYHPGIGVNILIEKSFVSILGGKLWMNDLLQKMGKDIVCGEDRNPGKRSRLWLSTDVLPVLRNNKGTEAVKSIFLSSPQEENVQLKADPFSEMYTLRLLKIKNMTFSGCSEFVLSDELRLFEWQGFPLKSLPSSFYPDKLVTLNLSQSKIETVWKEIKKPMEMLVKMDLSECKYLNKTPDFNAVPKLESLILKGCTRLHQVHPSIGILQQLIYLNLEGCKCLATLPNSIDLKYLKIFILSGCCKLERLPEIGENMKRLSELHLDETAIKELPISIKHLTGLLILNLKDCANISSLPDTICTTLSSLQVLNLSGCSNLQKLPDDLGFLESLEELDASRSGIREIPSSIQRLKNLKVLSFAGCQGDHLHATPSSWYSLLISCCLLPSDSAPSNCNSNSIGLHLPPSFSGLCSLEKLDLSNCNLREGAIPDDIGCLTELNSLKLSGNHFESLPDSISKLYKLQEFRLKDCSNLKALPELPFGVRSVSAQGCPLLGKDGMVWSSAAHGFTFIHLGEGEKDRCTIAPPIAEQHIMQQHCEKLFADWIDRGYEFVYFLIGKIAQVEIPKWFRQSTASSIRVPLPPDFDCNATWMGLALFVSYELHDNVDADGDQQEPPWDSLTSSHQYECHVYTNDDPLETPLVLQLENYNNVIRSGTYQYWIFIPRRELATRMNNGFIRAEIMPEVKLKEYGARLIYSDDVPKFIQSIVRHYMPANSKDVIGDYTLRNPDQRVSTKTLLASGPNYTLLREYNGIDQPRLLKQLPADDLIHPPALTPLDKKPTPFFIEVEPSASGSCHSSSIKIVGELKRNIKIFLHNYFEEGNAGYYDYGFTLSPKGRAILPWFSDQSVGSEVQLPHTPPNLYMDKTWLGLSVYAAFTVSPGSRYTCACYLITVEQKYLVRVLATCIIEDESSGSQRICIMHIPRARFPDQWNQCGQVFASFDILIPGGKKDVDMCGVRLIYEQDLEGLIQTITNCTIRSPPVYWGWGNKTEVTQPDGHCVGFTCMGTSLVENAKSRNYSKRGLEKIGHLFPLQRSLSTFPQPSGFIDIDQEIRLSLVPYTPLKQNRVSVTEWKRNLDLLLQSLLRIPNVSVTLKLGRADNYSFGSFDPYSELSTTFPRTKIPEWFNTTKHAPSSKLLFKLPPNLESNEDWVGIVACISFSVHASPADIQSYLDSDVCPELTCHIECCEFHDNLFSIQAMVNGTDPENKFMWLYSRGFIWLFYMTREFLVNNLHIDKQLLASFTSDSPQVLGVQGCGMRILYKQDVEDFRQTIISCFTSFFDKEDLIRQYLKNAYRDHHKKKGSDSPFSPPTSDSATLGSPSSRPFDST